MHVFSTTARCSTPTLDLHPFGHADADLSLSCMVPDSHGLQFDTVGQVELSVTVEACSGKDATGLRAGQWQLRVSLVCIDAVDGPPVCTVIDTDDKATLRIVLIESEMSRMCHPRHVKVEVVPISCIAQFMGWRGPVLVVPVAARAV